MGWKDLNKYFKPCAPMAATGFQSKKFHIKEDNSYSVKCDRNLSAKNKKTKKQINSWMIWGEVPFLGILFGVLFECLLLFVCFFLSVFVCFCFLMLLSMKCHLSMLSSCVHKDDNNNKSKLRSLATMRTTGSNIIFPPSLTPALW